MKPRLPRRPPSPSMVVALIALFVALGGSAVAASLITGKDVKNHSLTSKDIAKRTIGALRTASAHAQSTSPQQLSNAERTVLNKTIKLPSRRRITAVASVQAEAPASGTSSTTTVTCNLRIDNVDGVPQSTDVTSGTSTTFESVTVNQQSGKLPAGQHSVVVECNESTASTTSTVNVTDRSLSIVATG